jgi:hypothetical protein
MLWLVRDDAFELKNFDEFRTHFSSVMAGLVSVIRALLNSSWPALCRPSMTSLHTEGMGGWNKSGHDVANSGARKHGLCARV